MFRKETPINYETLLIQIEGQNKRTILIAIYCYYTHTLAHTYFSCRTHSLLIYFKVTTIAIIQFIIF